MNRPCPSSCPDFRLGIISCLPAARDGKGGLVCNHSIGRLVDLLRDANPGTKLCLPLLPEPQSHMRHTLNFPAEDIVPLPPLKSVISSQRYYFQTRRILRQFARQVDVLFIRWPFQIPTALVGLRTPKLLHVVGNAYKVIAASSDYRGVMKRLALAYAAHSNRTVQRMVAEPHTRVATNGAEMWDVLHCRAGRVVVSSCLYEREMRPRENRALGDPPRLLFVGYLRPEKGIHDLLDAFEQIRAKRPLKLTLVGGSDKSNKAGPRPPPTSGSPPALIAPTSCRPGCSILASRCSNSIVITTSSCCPASPKGRRGRWSKLDRLGVLP